ncbi:MAG: RNA polymerase sigma factor, partial [Pseudomonadales bacterium]|nr:RNA polymerase sigma factor [Pseudomonadales bacterium]
MSAMGEGEGELLDDIAAEISRESFESRERKNDAGELLTRALSGLNPEERMIVELVHLEGLSGREAADLLGWSVANVKIRAFRTRKKLKKILSDLMTEGDTL